MTDSGDAVRFLFIAGRSMRFFERLKTGGVIGRVVLAIGITPAHKTVPSKRGYNPAGRCSPRKAAPENNPLCSVSRAWEITGKLCAYLRFFEISIVECLRKIHEEKSDSESKLTKSGAARKINEIVT